MPHRAEGMAQERPRLYQLRDIVTQARERDALLRYNLDAAAKRILDRLADGAPSIPVQWTTVDGSNSEVVLDRDGTMHRRLVVKVDEHFSAFLPLSVQVDHGGGTRAGFDRGETYDLVTESERFVTAALDEIERVAREALCFPAPAPRVDSFEQPEGDSRMGDGRGY
jgi:hypothetical protein